MSQADGSVLPNPAIPKTLGILNIIFAVILTALGLCGAGALLAMPKLQEFGQQQTAQIKENEEKQRAAELKALDDRAAAATSDEEKETIARERDAVAKRPTAAPAALNLAGLPTDPRLIAVALVQAGWGLVLNVVLLASGIGLIRLRNWGRRACLAWAALSIATTVGFTIYGQVTGMAQEANQEQVAKLREAAARPGAGPQDQAALRGVEVVGQFTILIVLGSALAQVTYPIICLCLLNTARARAACLPGGGNPDRFGPEGYTLPPLS